MVNEYNSYAIAYPITTTSSGDLSTVSNLTDIAITRSRLLLDIKPGDRLLLPDYGVFIQPFTPDNQITTDFLINEQLEKYCTENLMAEFEITYRQDLDGSLKYHLQIKPL